MKNLVANLKQGMFENGVATAKNEFYHSLPVDKQRTLETIEKIIYENRLVFDRELALQDAGIAHDTFPMGSGGVGQIVEMSDHYRIQIGYGVGKHNYAPAAIIKK